MEALKGLHNCPKEVFLWSGAIAGDTRAFPKELCAGPRNGDVVKAVQVPQHKGMRQGMAGICHKLDVLHLAFCICHIVLYWAGGTEAPLFTFLLGGAMNLYAVHFPCAAQKYLRC